MNTPLDKYFLSAIRLLTTVVVMILLLNSPSSRAQDNIEPDKVSEEKQSPDEQILSKQEAAESQIDDSIHDIGIIRDSLEALRQEIDTSKQSTSLNRTSVKSIKDGLQNIEEKLEEVYQSLDKNEPVISKNVDTIEGLTNDILTKAREVRANAAELLSQKSLIEDNSIRLYETLIQVNTINEDFKKLSEELDGLKNIEYIDKIKADIADDLTQLWRLIAIILVFFAPLAFVISSNEKQYMALADGTEQHQGALLVCLGAFLGYFSIGFGLMYGTSLSGWIGTSNYWLAPPGDTLPPTSTSFTEFILFQSGFLVVGALIVYLSVGHKFSSALHMFLAVFVGAILIPIFGHWVWGGNFIAENAGWLQKANFQDLAGSATIHAIAAWFSFFLILKLQKLLPSDQTDSETFDSPVYSTSAIFLLWLSWIGFTTGSLSIADRQIPDVMLNVGLAASAAGLGAYFHYALFHNDKGRIAHALGGFVSGLAAIAACAQSVSVIEAAFIGGIAGLLHNISYQYLRRFFLKQTWQKRAAYLVSIHGVGGLWGILSVALFGTDGTFNAPNTILLLTQLKGIVVALVYCFFMANVMIFALRFFIRKPKQSA